MPGRGGGQTWRPLLGDGWEGPQLTPISRLIVADWSDRCAELGGGRAGTGACGPGDTADASRPPLPVIHLEVLRWGCGVP